MTNIRRGAAIFAVTAVAAGALTACGSGNSGDGGDGIIVGTTDKVISIDPAGSYDNGSLQVQTQVYQYLLNFPAGSTDLTPDAAEQCDFSEPTVYSCTMKDGLKFANGHDLTASDVAFSFKRIVDINDPNGPASLLGAMESVTAVDDKTVEFKLSSPNDVTFPQILVTSAGPIVDEEVYPADSVMDDEAVVEGQGFSGPYTIGAYTKNEVAEFKAFDGYDGAYNEPKTKTVTMSYYADANNLKLDIENGKIDVAWRSLTPTDIESLSGNDKVKVHQGAGGELRYIVFNLNTMPGDTDEQKQAIRQAMAASVDRNELSEQVYKGTFTPAWSQVPDGQPGAIESFKDAYGETPDKAMAEKFLTDAGVATPVTINLQYNPDHYGSNSDQEYNMVKRQLEASGLFKVDLQSTEWNTYNEERVNDTYPVFQLGWFPDFPDPDNYLTPFFAPNNFLQSHYEDDAMTALLDDQRTDGDKASRDATLAEIQKMLATQVPTLPLLMGSQVAIGGTDIQGLDETLDAAFKFRFTSLSKG